MTMGSHHARLGAFGALSSRRHDGRRAGIVVCLVLAVIFLIPGVAAAQDATPEAETSAPPSAPSAPSAPSEATEGAGDSGGTVRVRAVDNQESVALAEADENSAVASVPARAMPEATPETPEPTAGEGIVAFALMYVGYPYAWAGNTPAGFDCSGFTQFVVLNTIGVDIGHGLEGQPGAGAWVDAAALLPGDLVFFQNTYQPGLSHVGIYIGDGLFIHAENEGTGVVISGLYSDYYGPRYWGAVRVA